MDLVNPTVSAPTWAHLDNLRLGKWGEYFAKRAFVRAGLDVYSPEVDDRAIDALIHIPSDPPRYLEVQVKTVRAAKSGYIFMRKRTASSLAVPDDLVRQCRASRNQADGKENTPSQDRGQHEGGQTLQHDRSPTSLTWAGFSRIARPWSVSKRTAFGRHPARPCRFKQF
jgi:hypothetical protein